MTIKRKLPGESTSIMGKSMDDEHAGKLSEVEFSALLGRVIEDNPELPVSFIEDILVAMAEADAGKISDYLFD